MRDSLGGMPRVNSKEQGRMQLAEYFKSTRDHWAAYHNHKEQMAYGAATLYLAATTAAAITPARIWEPTISKLWFILSINALGLVAISFVRWQLGKREFAADLVKACGDLLTENLSGGEKSAALTAAPYGEHQFPAVLADRLAKIADDRKLLEGPRTSEFITYVAMGLWTCVAVIRVWHAA